MTVTGVLGRDDDESFPLSMEMASGVPARRCNLLVLKTDFGSFGTTIGCGGYRVLARASAKAQNHSERCRARIETELSKTVEGNCDWPKLLGE